jgi:hypothetical protein
VIQHEVVQSFIGVLEEELDHLDAISERIEGHLCALSNRDELVVIVFDPMASVQSQRTKVPAQGLLVFQVAWAETRHLHIEELGCVEHGLFFLSCHLIEQEGIVRVFNHVDAAIGVFIRAHICQDALF